MYFVFKKLLIYLISFMIIASFYPVWMDMLRIQNASPSSLYLEVRRKKLNFQSKLEIADSRIFQIHDSIKLFTVHISRLRLKQLQLGARSTEEFIPLSNNLPQFLSTPHIHTHTHTHTYTYTHSLRENNSYRSLARTSNAFLFFSLSFYEALAFAERRDASAAA